ncbi:MAG: response regulator transcription factor [Bacteroidetes bacterium]|nr:response regulator transcription factor [Bacteroidota bacterium]
MILSKITLLIADDHVIIRRGLKFLLESHFGKINIHETDSNKGILSALIQNNFTHLVLDMQLTDGNVIEIFNEVHRQYPELPILIYSMSPEEIFGKRMMQLGAAGYLNKQSSEDEVIRAMDSFFKEKKYMSQKLSQLISSENKKKKENPFEILSEREMEVLLMLLKGKGVKEIASHLDLKSNTVATFKARIFDKLGVNNIIDLQQTAKLYNLPTG